MLRVEHEALAGQPELTRRPRRLFSFVSSDDVNFDPFDIDVRIASSDERSPLERSRLAPNSIFGSCHSCQCTGPGCR